MTARYGADLWITNAHWAFHCPVALVPMELAYLVPTDDNGKLKIEGAVISDDGPDIKAIFSGPTPDTALNRTQYLHVSLEGAIRQILDGHDTPTLADNTYFKLLDRLFEQQLTLRQESPTSMIYALKGGSPLWVLMPCKNDGMELPHCLWDLIPTTEEKQEPAA